ncbi:hypothetical protein ACFL2V_04490 [Pseudomonadota bacterium]
MQFMPYYYHINNEKLRELVKVSESIHSLDENDAQDMINQIAALPEEGQVEMLKALENEQKAIAAAKAAKSITPEQEIAELDANIAKVGSIKREFESSVRRHTEDKDREQEGQEAEDLLKGLNDN